MRKPVLLYLAPQKSSFVRKDLEILSHHFKVKFQDFSGAGALNVLKSLIRQFFFLLWNLPRSKRVVVMFGGYHAFLPSLMGRMLGKKVYIILGGTDCVSFPSIHYGTFRKPFQGKVACASYRLASMLLPVHHSLIYREDTYYTVDSAFQGCRFWCKNLQTPALEIHNGYDAQKWEVDASKKSPHSFVTIAAIPDRSKIILKGIDLIVEIAPLFPQCDFTIIGLQSPDIHISNAPNVTVLPFLPPEKLLEMLEEKRFYLQLSISEGFPNALCEAMLAECIPIGSNVAAIPEIIGETGFILPTRSQEALAQLVASALKSQDLGTMGASARQRIASLYPIDKREKMLLDALNA